MSQVQKGNSTTTTSSRRYPALATKAGLAASTCQQVSRTRSRAILVCTVQLAGVTVVCSVASESVAEALRWMESCSSHSV